MLFCVRSVAEAVHADESLYVARIVNAECLGRLPLEAVRLRQTVAYLLGAYAEWIKNHADIMPLAVQLLSDGLRTPATVSAAAKGLKEVCDVCRTHLAAGLPYLLSVYQETKHAMSVCRACCPLSAPPGC